MKFKGQSWRSTRSNLLKVDFLGVVLSILARFRKPTERATEALFHLHYFLLSSSSFLIA